MSLVDHTPATQSPDLQAVPEKKRRRPWWRRALRTLGVVVAIVTVVVVVCSLANVAITKSEKLTLAPYGHKVSIASGDINVYRNGCARMVN